MWFVKVRGKSEEVFGLRVVDNRLQEVLKLGEAWCRQCGRSLWAI